MCHGGDVTPQHALWPGVPSLQCCVGGDASEEGPIEVVVVPILRKGRRAGRGRSGPAPTIHCRTPISIRQP
eukprot:6481545-Prorocentrum_lima.AAC.1